MRGNELRKVLLEVVSEQAGSHSLQSGTVIPEAARRLKVRNHLDQEQALLTFWYDLFRMGYLSWGYDIANPTAPFCHITDQGRQALAHLSRDPANPDGYLNHLSSSASLDTVAMSYIREALRAFNANCPKSAAVMTGGAAERIVLCLRDRLQTKMVSLGCTVPSKLKDWRTKRVLDAIEAELKSKQNQMPATLVESFQAHWSAFAHQIRSSRNEAGHPVDVDPVREETVHGNLLIFIQLAELASQLQDWIDNSYS